MCDYSTTVFLFGGIIGAWIAYALFPQTVAVGYGAITLLGFGAGAAAALLAYRAFRKYRNGR